MITHANALPATMRSTSPLGAATLEEGEGVTAQDPPADCADVTEAVADIVTELEDDLLNVADPLPVLDANMLTDEEMLGDVDVVRVEDSETETDMLGDQLRDAETVTEVVTDGVTETDGDKDGNGNFTTSAGGDMTYGFTPKPNAPFVLLPQQYTPESTDLMTQEKL